MSLYLRTVGHEPTGGVGDGTGAATVESGYQLLTHETTSPLIVAVTIWGVVLSTPGAGVAEGPK